MEAGAGVGRGWEWGGTVRCRRGAVRCGAGKGRAGQGRAGQGRVVGAFSAARRLVVDGSEHVTDQQLAALCGQPVLLRHAAAGVTPSEGGRGSTGPALQGSSAGLVCRARLQGRLQGSSAGLVCWRGVGRLRTSNALMTGHLLISRPCALAIVRPSAASGRGLLSTTCSLLSVGSGCWQRHAPPSSRQKSDAAAMLSHVLRPGAPRAMQRLAHGAADRHSSLPSQQSHTPSLTREAGTVACCGQRGRVHTKCVSGQAPVRGSSEPSAQSQ